MPLDIDADVRVARTPPAALYRDTDAFAWQRDRVLGPSWQLLCDGATRATVGATPDVLLPGLLDEPVLVTHHDGVRRVLPNVCTHRGALLCEAATASPTVRCPYHGRRFALDGQLLRAPGFEDAPDFPGATDHLRPFASQSVGPLLFASRAPQTPFAELFAGLDAFITPLLARPVVEDLTARVDHALDAHWLLYVENYLEGFHIPYVHPSLAQTLDLDAYPIHLTPFGAVQVGLVPASEPALDLPAGHPASGARVGALYAWLFPNTMINLYPWGVSLNQVLPQSVGRTVVRYRQLVADARLRDAGPGGALDAVELEDQRVVRLVQRGLHSSGYERGRYSATHERAVHHLHRLLAATGC